jgi:uncharacterized membrane protein
MRSILRRIWKAGILGNLLAGLLVVLPLALTVLIIGWLIGIVASILGPGSWFGGLLTTGGEAIVGEKRELIAFLIGAAIGVAGLWLLGLTVRAQARRAIDQTFDNLLGKVPLFRAVYRPVSQVVRLLAGSNADLAAMSVVMCRLGGEQGSNLDSDHVYPFCIAERNSALFFVFAILSSSSSIASTGDSGLSTRRST